MHLAGIEPGTQEALTELWGLLYVEFFWFPVCFFISMWCLPFLKFFFFITLWRVTSTVILDLYDFHYYLWCQSWSQLHSLNLGYFPFSILQFSYFHLLGFATNRHISFSPKTAMLKIKQFLLSGNFIICCFSCSSTRMLNC